MDYITVSEAAKKWGVSKRRVQYLCINERIKGAVRFGAIWHVPASAVLPNARKKSEEPHLPMPRKSPFLDMTNLYHTPGQAAECAEMLINQPEAHALFLSQIAYRRGEIEAVYEQARYFLSSRSGFYAIIGGGMLLAQCAIWRGDIFLWEEAKKHIFEAPCKDEHDREIVSLALAIIDSTVYDNKDYPEWFRIGNFEGLPADSHPATKVFYIKYLYMTAFAVASRQVNVEDMQGLSMMRMIPSAIEPLITQAVVDKTVIPEIYLRLSCAVAYYNSGQRERAVSHIDKVLALALPDRLYGILTEYIRHFEGLLEERIALLDEAALEEILALYDVYKIGWARLSSKVKSKYVAANLTSREHEVAKLSAFGFRSSEIATMLHLSESTIKQTIARVLNKTGLTDKSEFSYIL